MTTLTPAHALRELVAGNQRYFVAKAAHPRQTLERRREVAHGQHPFAAILGCSDSRVPPEILFDQGLGDLFVVRVAGNIVDDVVLGSLEYAADHLAVPLIVVLGHGKCGAVTAAVAGGGAHGHVGSVLAALRPAVERTAGRTGDPVQNVVRANVDLGVERLRAESALLAGRERAGTLKIAGAHYDVDTGAVTFW